MIVIWRQSCYVKVHLLLDVPVASRFTSPLPFACAFLNLTQDFDFVLSQIFRKPEVDLKNVVESCRATRTQHVVRSERSG